MNTKLIPNKLLVGISTGVIGLATGVVLGKFLSDRRWKGSVNHMLDDLQADMKLQKLGRRMDPNFVVWDKQPKTDDGGDPLVVDHEQFNEERSLQVLRGNELVDELKQHHLAEQAEAQERREAARHHTFDTPTDDWDYEAERNIRSTKEIYVIHRDEYAGNEFGYHQSTIEYYAEDGVMVDVLEHPIYNYTDFVGPEALDQFGHGSGASDVVFVRNEKEKAEFEVLLNKGSYEKEVLGLETEEEYREQDLRHSKYPIYKFPIRE